MSEDDFIPSFPCYSPKNRSGTGGMVHELVTNELYTVILTDDDLLDRYRAKHKIDHTGANVILDVAGLLAFLNVLPEQVVYVAFDPPERGNPSLLRVKELRERVALYLIHNGA